MQPLMAAKSPVQGGASRGNATSPTPKNASVSHHPPAGGDAFGYPPTRPSQNFSTSPTTERRSVDRLASPYRPGSDGDRPSEQTNATSSTMPTLLLRKLPANMNEEALASMLLFAEDLVDARLASYDYPDERGFVTAIARFGTFEGALEVRNRLHGKSNASHDATMIVEVIQGGNTNPSELRRRSSDAHNNRQLSPAVSSGASSGGPASRQSSRFNNAFQSFDRISPTRRAQGPNGLELPGSDMTNHMQNIFSPQSPIGNPFGDRTRVTGKSVISDDSVDDETGDLLNDLFASGQMDSGPWQSRNASLPISRLANLKLDTGKDAFSDPNNMIPPPGAGYGSTRHAPMPLKSPGSEFTPNGVSNGMAPLSPTGTYQTSPQHYQRHQYPPANPADQNPPCNTLYVGNLPIDTSEDELKAMFSKQRGYKRLCFRTKHNGPMCFVEFEDISFATKALNELYGHPLHNSVKGGIRLSFSKNPLGVRTGQGTGMGPTSPLTSPSAPGFGNIGCPPGFSTANGPPPGLPMPGNSMSNVNPHTTPSFFPPNSPPALSSSNHSSFRHPSISGSFGASASGGSMHSIGTGFSEYSMTR